MNQREHEVWLTKDEDPFAEAIRSAEIASAKALLGQSLTFPVIQHPKDTE